MIFEIKNLGSIEHAEIEMGNLTIIGGKNNTGKTYITYSVWGMLREIANVFWEDRTKIIAQLEKLKLEEKLQEGETIEIPVKNFDSFYKELPAKLKNIKIDLAALFNTNKSNFKGASINTTSIEKELFFAVFSNLEYEFYDFSCKKDSQSIEIKCNKKPKNNPHNEFLLALYEFLLINASCGRISVIDPFLLTAQRDAIWLFQKEIDKHRNDILGIIRKNHNTNILEKELSNFAQPIEENIKFIRDLDALEKQSADEEYATLASYIQEISGIDYVVKDNRLFLIDKNTQVAFPAYLGSTSVRSLAMLHLWLNSQKGNATPIMIDEPEMSLHPENQVKIARLLVRLVNAGFRVWITTHSDYIIKELNNCLMLANDFEGKEALMKELGYTKNDILKADDLRAYIAHSGSVERIQTDSFGMMTSAFDETISQINNAAEKLSEAISEKQTK